MTVEVTDKSAGVRMRLQSVVALLAGCSAVAGLSLAGARWFRCGGSIRRGVSR